MDKIKCWGNHNFRIDALSYGFKFMNAIIY